MKVYWIEPGDWEAATGESLPGGRRGICVAEVADAREYIDVCAEALKAVDADLDYLQRLWGKEGVTERAVQKVKAALAKLEELE